MHYLAPHSERKMTYNIAEDLSLEDFWIRTITTDGGTKSWLGMEDFYQTLKTCLTCGTSSRSVPSSCATTRQGKFFSVQSRHVSGLKPQQRCKETCTYSLQQGHQGTFQQYYQRNVRAQPRGYCKMYLKVT